MLTLRDNHIGADPGFLAPDKLDFRSKLAVPVLKTGFQPSSFEKIDLQRGKTGCACAFSRSLTE